MWTTAEIRRTFLDYFKSKDHTVVASSPLIPHQDPSLLFINAGMVPFKNYFTGIETPPYARATSSQKCVRAGGKHNDLENVGYTARHHTFFEMLGNFSFGAYFKEEAIHFAWDFVHRVLNLPKERLLVTVFHTDDEAASLWKKIAGLSEDRIIRIAGADNFWSMGNTGPCGPCSEIFYDHGPEIAGGPPGSPDENGDRFVEIWNLVFMQYDQQAGTEEEPGKRLPLPTPSIDTGSGLERLTAVLQDVHNNYDIDLFQHLIQISEEISGVKASGEALFSHRVISDHLRASGFLIADGVMPSNEGRGYVLRRIMRRAMRHAYLLGCQEPLMHKLVPALVGQMGQAFPELNRAETLIMQTLKAEENRFRSTLGKGLKLLSEASRKIDTKGILPGDIAFKLYDTYGFPLDLTQDILRTEGKSVDEDAFNQAMLRQKEEARSNWAGSGENQSEAIWFDLAHTIKDTEFLGYISTEADGYIEALLIENKPVSCVQTGQSFSFICNQTPFYAESGGQVGDTGAGFTTTGAQIKITNTLKKGKGFFVHEALLEKGILKKGEIISLHVEEDRRKNIKANHSATHILHKVLRDVLGDQVVQKGSLVAPDRLRFDFSHEGALTSEQLKHIESKVNRFIRQNFLTETQVMTPEEALKTGAMALFGEKYSDEVRVVFMGDDLHDRELYRSIEFCGGTHVTRTGDIGFFKILNETGVAAGIRRIEAITGQSVETYVQSQEDLVQSLSHYLKTNAEGLPSKIKTLLEDKKALEKEIKKLQHKLAGSGATGTEPTQDTETIGDIVFVGRCLEGIPAKELRPLADQLRQNHPEAIIALVAENDGKASLVVSLSKTLTNRFSAVDLVKAGSEAVGGKGGGGRPDMAQAGGPDGTKAAVGLEAIKTHLRKTLGL